LAAAPAVGPGSAINVGKSGFGHEHQKFASLAAVWVCDSETGPD
jgi:hypothetical protein